MGKRRPLWDVLFLLPPLFHAEATFLTLFPLWSELIEANIAQPFESKLKTHDNSSLNICICICDIV